MKQIVDTAVFIDLDRTLIKSDELLNIVVRYLGSQNPEHDEKLKTYAAKVRRGRGSSVPAYRVLRDNYNLEPNPVVLARAVVAHVGIDEVSKSVVVDGAAELIALLMAQAISGNSMYGLLTYTDDPIGQKFKIELLKLLMPTIKMNVWIIGHQHKADSIVKMFDTNSKVFTIVGSDGRLWEAKRVYIIDDKVQNLSQALPDRIYSLHVHPDGEISGSSMSLNDATGKIRRYFDALEKIG